MYVNLTAKFSAFDKEDPRIVIQYYRIYDTNFRHDFSATYIRDRYGVLDDVHHINQLLFNIYDAYKHSKWPVCKNFKLVMKNTFPLAASHITETKFYKEHRALVDKSMERKPNVIKY